MVWITGASSGIGEALAQAFAQAGARLILSGRRAAELERVAAACTGTPLRLAAGPHPAPGIRPAVADSTPLPAGSMSRSTTPEAQRALAQETLPAVERAIMEVNYFGPVGLTKAALPLLLAQGAGSVVVISSVMGYLGTPMRSAYAASKHALHGWFDCLREETRPTGLHVGLVCPGYVRTQISTHALTATGSANARPDSNSTRGIAPEACAAAILRAVASRRDEILVGGPEIWAVRLKRFAPRLWTWLLRREVARGRFGPSSPTRP
ncbi:MAG: SDR family NAD(P)-dependent oxidoreductase [Opitutaceae bacterium]|nr:SDR family NAD(P)-dependent oxidoreductase [Opitutaceae bacterium]